MKLAQTSFGLFAAAVAAGYSVTFRPYCVLHMIRRYLILAHRYLGIGLGLIMALWCLSGFVMMYMPFPSVSKQQSLQGNGPLDLSSCCNSEALPGLALVDVNRFVVEMMGDVPVLRIRASGMQNPVIDLSSGEVVQAVDEQRALAIASRFAANLGLPGGVEAAGQVDRDQWTVTSFYDRHRPLHHFRADEADATRFYVSSSTGEVVQLSTGTERFWNWLGAVPHWLYPTVLRQHSGLWAQVIIWSSLGGTFLTVFGIYIGVLQYRFRRKGRRSPYGGLWLWHHYTGLIFGVLVLTWVVSGLFSVNPWGLFEFSGSREQRQLQGVPLIATEVEDFVQRLPEMDLPPGTARLEAYTLQGQLYVLAYGADGSYQRYNRNLQAAPIEEGEWSRLAQAVAGDTPIAEAGLLEQEDAYYYGHKRSRELPVYRIILDNSDQTRFYLNATSGELAGYFDRSQRIYRWLFNGLHRLDLSNWLRRRPVWDLVVWLLLTGVTASTLTGVYMGARRIKRWNVRRRARARRAVQHGPSRQTPAGFRQR